MVGQSHICVFDVGSDECLVCGTQASLVGQRTLKPQQASWKQAIQDIGEQVPRSPQDWSHKPHFARLICICLGCLALLILVAVFLAVAASIDANECNDETHACAPNAKCTNLDGTYTCDCNAGYIGSGRECSDVDECAAGTVCHVDATCQNTPGSFVCACNDGFVGGGIYCADVDECSDNNGGCGPALFNTCINRHGQPNLCADVLECGTDNGGCGNATLVQCQERIGMPPVCHDIDECATNNGNCGSGYTCINRDGRTGQNHGCVDVDECMAGTHSCDIHANCSNSPEGSYSCNCSSGYQGNGMQCQDVNECATANGGCDMFCLNHDGGFSCACASRFVLRPGNGFICDDVDECAQDNGGCGPPLYFSCSNMFGAPPNCSGGYPVCPGGTGNGFYVDCDGACFTAELTQLGDQFCDDGFSVPNFNCSMWNFDDGDC